MHTYRGLLECAANTVQHFTESPRKLAHTSNNTTAENEETRAHEADCSAEPRDKRKHKLSRSAAARLLVRSLSELQSGSGQEGYSCYPEHAR